MLDQKSEIKDQKYKLDIKNNFRERCFNYSLSVMRFIDTLPEKRTFSILSDQLLRSSTSIGANFVEAKAASSKKDYIRYYEIALKSANESIYWLELLHYLLTDNKVEIGNLLDETHELASIVAASLITMKKRNQI